MRPPAEPGTWSTLPEHLAEGVAIQGSEASALGAVRLLVLMLDERSPGYAAHAERVARTAHMLGDRFGMDAEQLQELRVAALLHDVGLLRLEVRHVGSRWHLATEERSQYERHPSLGAQMARIVGLGAAAQAAIAAHHERWDGTGYPRGLRGAKSPVPARILAACDALDAMTRPRSDVDVEVMPVEVALARLDGGEGRRFDPCIAAALRDVIAEETELQALTGLSA